MMMMINSPPVGSCWEVYMIRETPFIKFNPFFSLLFSLTLPQHIRGFIRQHCPVRPYPVEYLLLIQLLHTAIEKPIQKKPAGFQGAEVSLWDVRSFTWPWRPREPPADAEKRKLADIIFSVLICVAAKLLAMAIIACNWMRFLSGGNVCAAEASKSCKFL